MKRVEGVWAELSANQEVELSEVQKIELGVIDDLKALEQEAFSIAKKRIAESKQLEKEFQRINKENFAAKENVEELAKRAFRIAMEAERTLKDMGIDVPRELGDRSDAVSRSGGKIPTSRNASIFTV